MECVPFESGLIPQAAELVASRQAEQSKQFKLLPTQYEASESAKTAVDKAWGRELATGAAILEGNQLLGYLFGDISDNELRGKSAWIRLAGHCLKSDQDWELMRDLYQAAASIWVERGCFNHFAITFADPESLKPWENLVFAREQIYALREITNSQPVEMPKDLEIRRATASDADIFRRFSTIILGTQSQSPSFAPAHSAHVEKMREGYAGVPVDADAISWLALVDGEPVGFIAFFPPEKEGFELMIPEDAIELTISGTLSEVQAQGVGTALVEHALRELSRRGFKYCMADWHVPNLLSSRFWPKRGFTPVVYRMKRVIAPHILEAQVSIP